MANTGQYDSQTNIETEDYEREIFVRPEAAVIYGGSVVNSVNGQVGDVVLTTSDLENTSDYQTGAQVQNAIAGKQNVIADLPQIRSGAEAGATAVQPEDLARIATTGSYNDSLDKPSINNVALIWDISLDALGIQPKGNYALESEIPDVSNFITNTVDNLVNYYKKSETFTKQEVNDLISAITTMDIQVVQTLPTEDISTTTIYFVPKTTAGTNDVYDEYVYVSNAWEHIGSTDIDLSGYQTKIDSSHKLSSDLVDDTNSGNKFVTTSEKQTWNNKLDQSDLTNYVTFDDYATEATTGVVKTSAQYGISTSSDTKNLTAVTKTYAQYQNGDNAMFVGKGTLENVITGKNLETDNNKVTSISSSSTDVQYPSAKCVYTNVLQLYNTKAEVINNTATGSIAHIEDGANNYSINSLITDINHIQDLHGYNSPWAGGEGKNLLDPSKVSTITAYGLTITFSNNVFSISGTPTTQSTSLSFNIIDYSDYSLSGKNYVIQALEISGTPIKSIYGFRTEQEKRIAIVFDSVANPTINTTFKLSVSTTSQTVWSPYENICPITGWTGATISQSGEDTSSPTTRNISWQSEAGIIYGGTLDVISGVLTVTDQNIASYNGETLPLTWISDRDKYEEGTIPTIGAQVVYKLETPITYQLTPLELKTLLGTNNFWANTGDVTVNYKADTKNYIDSNIPDLTNYVTFDNFATSTTAGVVKTNSQYGVSTSSYTQNITATTKTYEQYQSSNNATFVGKGTLENVITGKDLDLKQLSTFDSTKTQVLKNINGTLTWVDE